MQHLRSCAKMGCGASTVRSVAELENMMMTLPNLAGSSDDTDDYYVVQAGKLTPDLIAELERRLDGKSRFRMGVISLAIARISLNESNRQILIDGGALPLLVRALPHSIERDEDSGPVVEALLQLSFDDQSLCWLQGLRECGERPGSFRDMLRELVERGKWGCKRVESVEAGRHAGALLLRLEKQLIETRVVQLQRLPLEEKHDVLLVERAQACESIDELIVETVTRVDQLHRLHIERQPDVQPVEIAQACESIDELIVETVTRVDQLHRLPIEGEHDVQLVERAQVLESMDELIVETVTRVDQLHRLPIEGEHGVQLVERAQACESTDELIVETVPRVDQIHVLPIEGKHDVLLVDAEGCESRDEASGRGIIQRHEPPQSESDPEDSVEGKHVMLSYSWTQKELVKELAKVLPAPRAPNYPTSRD